MRPLAGRSPACLSRLADNDNSKDFYNKYYDSSNDDDNNGSNGSNDNNDRDGKAYDYNNDDVDDNSDDKWRQQPINQQVLQLERRSKKNS